MSRREAITTAVFRWLDAERRDDGRQAERALRAVFVAVPLPRLDEAFTARVVAAIEPARAAARWTLERVAAAALVLCSLGLWALPVWLSWAWPRLPRLDWSGALSTAVKGGTAFAVGAASVLRWMVEVGQLTAVTLGHPVVLGSVAVCGVLVVTSSRVLYGLLHQRSQGYVES